MNRPSLAKQKCGAAFCGFYRGVSPTVVLQCPEQCQCYRTMKCPGQDRIMEENERELYSFRKAFFGVMSDVIMYLYVVVCANCLLSREDRCSKKYLCIFRCVTMRKWMRAFESIKHTTKCFTVLFLRVLSSKGSTSLFCFFLAGSNGSRPDFFPNSLHVYDEPIPWAKHFQKGC